MSTQRGNVKKKGPPKYQNKGAFKNVYHDTSKRTKTIVNTEVAGVCMRCKDAVDWKIKYKKYKPLTQPKTCAMCNKKTIKQAYHTYCIPCSTEAEKCAKCGAKNGIVMEPKPSAAEQAREDRQLQFELEMLPERKRRTFLRLREKGQLSSEKVAEMLAKGGDDFDSDNSDFDLDDEAEEEGDNSDDSAADKDCSDLTGKTDELKLGAGDG